MSNVPVRSDVDRRPVIYPGRFVDQITGIDLPSECVVLGEQDVLLPKLAKVLNHASLLVVLDLLSFPFKAMIGAHWGVPIVVVLPSEFNTASLTATFGSVPLERLGFFDGILASDSALWERMRRKYCWAESQRIPTPQSDCASEVATAVCTLFESESTSLTILSREQHGAVRHWQEHNRMLAAFVSEQVVHSINYDLRFNKTLHRVQAAALEPWFTAPLRRRNTEVPLDILEVGAGVGRWASSFDPAKTRFVGIDAREELVRAARANFPEQRFDLLGSDLLLPYDDESFDLVFSVTFMHHNSYLAKRTLLSEMWRVARPGGRLLFLENFVFTKEQLEESGIHPMSVTEFEDLILKATTGQVVLEHVESLRYPDEDLYRGGLISLLRLGVPRAR